MGIKYVFNPFTGNFDAINTTPAPSPSVTTFALANGQASFSDITGFLIDPSINKAFSALTSTTRYYTNTFVSQEDSAFYSNTTGLGSTSFKIIELADSTILAAGSFSGGLDKFSSTGVLDSTFSTNIGSGANNTVYAEAQQSNTQIVVGGDFTSFNGTGINRIIRLNLDGTVDTTFSTNIGTGFNNIVRSIAIQSDQKIVIGGDFTSFNGNTRNRLVRLNTDGTEDTSFYTNLGTGFTSSVLSVTIQTDQKILAGGLFNSFNGNGIAEIVRLGTTGAEDTAFSANLASDLNGSVASVIQLSTGKIVIGGSFNTYNSNTRNYLLRLNSDGTEDTAFYANLGTGFSGGTVLTVSEQDSHYIIVSGAFSALNGNTRINLVRLNPDGTEDTAFYLSLGSSFNNTVLNTAVQANKTLLIVGGFTSFNGSTRNYIIRFGVLADLNLVAQDTLAGVYHDTTTTWSIDNDPSFGDVTGVLLQMTDLGQLQYESSYIIGTQVIDEFKFQIVSL